MIIKTVDLITIQNIAKSFKQKDFVLLNNKLYSTNINYYLVTSGFPVDIIEPIILNYKELSDFIKNITIETEFEVSNNTIINNAGVILPIRFPTKYQLDELISKIDYINRISANNKVIKYGDVTSELEKVFSMKIADGSYYYNKDNIYFMTLFSGLFPLNKADKIELDIMDLGNTFISKFDIIKKKNIKISIYVHYLKV